MPPDRQALAARTCYPGVSALPNAFGTPFASDLLRNGALGRPMVAFDNLFGVHGAALQVRSQRMGMLASNIANASTPNFKARDIDFNAALGSMEGGRASLDGAVKYRVPTQPSMDGNTVELSLEQTAFAENAVQYHTTLAFLNGRIGTITRALKGE